MNWRTGKQCNYSDKTLYGLPSPWCDLDGIEVTESIGGCITASIPLSFEDAQDLVGLCGVSNSDGEYRDNTVEEIREMTRKGIGAVDRMSGEWVMDIAPDGSSDSSPIMAEFRVGSMFGR